MYYSAGTYESFAHPEKPKDVDKKSAYIIGTGIIQITYYTGKRIGRQKNI